MKHLAVLSLGLRSLLSTSFLVVGARIAGGLIGFVSQILIARRIGTDSLGVFFLALSLAGVLSILGTVGYPWIITRYIAKFEKQGEAPPLRALLALVRREIVVASTGLMVLAAGFVMFVPVFSPDARTGLLIGIMAVPLFAFMKMNAALANAQKHFMLAYLPDLFWRPLLLYGLIASLLAVFERVSISVLLAGHLVIVLFLVAFQSFRLARLSHRRGLANRSSTLLSRERKTTAEFLGIRRHALPMVLATLFVAMFADLDIVIAGTLMPDRELAVFSVCLKIALFLAFSIQAVHQIILRDAADALHAEDLPLLRRIIGRTNIITTALSVGALLTVVLWGHYLLGLFGNGFAAGRTCLILLVCAQVVRSLAGPNTQILTLTGDERRCIPVFAGALVLLVLCNAILVPAMHLTGAALSVFIATLAWSGGLAVVTRRHTGIVVFGIATPLRGKDNSPPLHRGHEISGCKVS